MNLENKTVETREQCNNDSQIDAFVTFSDKFGGKWYRQGAIGKPIGWIFLEYIDCDMSPSHGEPLAGLMLTRLNRRCNDGYKWPESSPQTVESTNKWCCHQKGKQMSSHSIDILIPTWL
ncbi:hypothetical protein TNCV_602711 [Trichonephila clavipes]|nr:hypothetical protein TNCV_602711 [Trichonephila clavipes]